MCHHKLLPLWEFVEEALKKERGIETVPLQKDLRSDPSTVKAGSSCVALQTVSLGTRSPSGLFLVSSTTLKCVIWEMTPWV